MSRIGRRNRWCRELDDNPGTWVRLDPDDEADVQHAVKDLTDDEGDLSVYRVEREPRGRVIAVLYSMVHRDRPERVEYVLIPDECLEGFTVDQVDPNIGPEFLRLSHFEIKGIRDADRRSELAKRVLRNEETRVRRLSKTEVIRDARRLLEVDEFDAFVSTPKWRKSLGLAG